MVYAIFLCALSQCTMVPLGPDRDPNGYFASKGECEQFVLKRFGNMLTPVTNDTYYRCLGREPAWR
jgi:hypothetical protein